MIIVYEIRNLHPISVVRTAHNNDLNMLTGVRKRILPIKATAYDKGDEESYGDYIPKRFIKSPFGWAWKAVIL